MARLRVVLQQLWRCGAVLFGCWQALREGILCVCGGGGDGAGSVVSFVVLFGQALIQGRGLMRGKWRGGGRGALVLAASQFGLLGMMWAGGVVPLLRRSSG